MKPCIPSQFDVRLMDQKIHTGTYCVAQRWLAFCPLEKPHTHAFRSEIENKPRASLNATKLRGHSQCVIWDVHEKIQREKILLRRVFLRFCSCKNRIRTRSDHKFKIVETLRNSGDTLNVLFGMSMKKFIGKLFP